jgi:hypothetical protein
MRKNLLNLLALPLVVGLMAGCSSDDDDTSSAPVEPAVCVYHLEKSTFDIGEDGTLAGYAVKGEEKITDVVVDPASVDTSVADQTEVKLTSVTCADDGATKTVTVSEASIPPMPDKILPF